MNFQKPFKIAADCIYPRTCILCGSSLFSETLTPYAVCPSCITQFIPITGKRCAQCGRVLISEKKLCLYCRKRLDIYSFDRNIAVFPYREAVKEAIFQYKFKNEKNLALLFAEFVYNSYLSHFTDEPIVPVPTNVWKKRLTGRDSVDEIAIILEKKYGLSIVRIIKKEKTKAQKTLSFEQRMINLNGKFYLKNGNKELISVVLFDDVFTTGGTISACAEVLKNSGIHHVSSLTIAID